MIRLPVSAAAVAPGGVIEAGCVLPPLATGRHDIQLDLVSELMFWFADCGGEAIALQAVVD